MQPRTQYTILISCMLTLAACSSGGDGGGGNATLRTDDGTYHLSVCIDPPRESDRDAIGELLAYAVASWNGAQVPAVTAAPALGEFDLLTILLHETGHLAGIDDVHLPVGQGVMQATFFAGGMIHELTAADFALLGEADTIFTLEYAGLGRDCDAAIIFAPLDDNILAKASPRWGGVINTNYAWHVAKTE